MLAGDRLSVQDAAAPEICSIGEISADWLERSLAKAGFTGAKIAGFTATPIGTGQAAICCRVEIDYVVSDPSWPRSVVIKFPSEDENSKRTGLLAFTYLREVNFYRYLQPLLSIRTPRCYLAEADDEGARFALILDDLAPAAQGDQIAGCTPDIARAAIGELARLHASSWHNPAVFALDWASFRTEDSGRAAADYIRTGLPHFLERCADGLTVAERTLLDRVARVEIFPSEVEDMKTHCLVHHDYRLDNFLIDQRGGATTIHVVDWQTFGTGNPMWDLAYFLGGCLLPEVRQKHEHDLVRNYHDELLAAGAAADYGWENCWHDYRRSSYHGLINCMAAMVYVTPTERGDRLFAAMVERYAKQIIELGADEFLD